MGSDWQPWASGKEQMNFWILVRGIAAVAVVWYIREGTNEYINAIDELDREQ
jgi:hypothetical protein